MSSSHPVEHHLGTPTHNMKGFIFIFLCIANLLLAITTSNAQQVDNEDDLKARIDTYLGTSVNNGFSGSVLVAIRGEIILAKGYGWSDRKTKIPNRPSTVFNIGSVTKQFTASAILKLLEQGKIKLTDQLDQFFPEAPADKRIITIHQLLTHTSGISNRIGGFRYDEAPLKKFLTDFFESELQSDPGTMHQYANANYIMLAAIVEHISKQSYNSFLYDYFWQPLEMGHTGYKSISFNSEHLAHGYYYNIMESDWSDWGTTQEHLPYSNEHWYSIGKGDMHSSVEDLYKWHLALNSHEALTSFSVELQNTPHVAENDKGTSHYGYGWAVINSDRNTKIITHNGSNGVYFADFIRFIDDDVVIIYLTNAFLGIQSENVAWEISKMVFDPNYIATPLSKNTYELINDFINANKPENASMLPSYVETGSGAKLESPSILNRVGYHILKNEPTPGWALELFKLNVQLFPEDGNSWDSLGESYLKYELKEEAIKCYKKAVELNFEHAADILEELLK